MSASFPYVSNPKNPLGLIVHQTAVYELVAYFFFNNAGEIHAESKLSLNISDIAFKYANANKMLTINGVADSNVMNEMNRQISMYMDEKNVQRHKAYYLGYGHCLLFRKYEKPISFRERKHIPKSQYQAVMDYFASDRDKKLPLLVTDNRLFALYHNQTQAFGKDYDRHVAIDYNGICNVIQQSQKEIELQKKRHEIPVPEVKSYNNLHQEERKLKAILKGGCISVTQDNEEYFIPKLPLIAYIKKINHKITVDLHTWFFDFKIDDFDSSILSDIFIIADLPIEKKNDHKWIDLLLKKANEKL